MKLTNTRYILSLRAFEPTRFDNVAKLCYGEFIFSPLPTPLSLLGVGVSWFHIQNKNIAGESRKLLAHMALNSSTSIL